MALKQRSAREFGNCDRREFVEFSGLIRQSKVDLHWVHFVQQGSPGLPSVGLDSHF